MFGALRFGKGPVGGTKVGIVGSWGWVVLTPDWDGMVPGLVIAEALPGPCTSYFLAWVKNKTTFCAGGASAVKETMFSPLMMTSPKVLLICF